MPIAKARLTILFEAPFWIGLYERESEGRYEAAKITFGAEPKDHEVYAFLLENWRRLRFSPALAAAEFAERRVNPKRLQRQIRRMTENTGIGTKAQQALKLQQETQKAERKSSDRERREEEKARQFDLRQEKKRQKHRGH